MQILGILIFLVGLWVIIDSFFAAINEKKSSENQPDRSEKSVIDHPPHPPLFLEFWRKSFDFKGKTSRRDYWITVLQLGCIYLFVLSLALLHSLKSSNTLEGLNEFSINFGWIVAIFTFIPNLAIQVRRLNDIGKEPVWVLLSFVPFVSLILIFWYAKPSQNSQLNENKKRSDYININGVDELAEAEEKLAKLKSMLKRGVISDQEYEELRKKTLGL